MSEPIKVLSYNTSWEASEPKPNWNEKVNFYEPERTEAAKMVASEAPLLDYDDEGKFTKREGTPTRVDTRKYTNKMLGDLDKAGEFGDGEDGISFNCNNDPERCRKNIFSIIQNGNFDLVGMQEYVHDTYSIETTNEIKENVYSKKEYIPSLGNMKLVLGHVPLNMTKWVNGVQTKTGNVKRVEIGSLYNKTKFKEVEHHCFDLGPDGRPVLIVLLKEKSSDSHILFINAHMPQGYNIKGEGTPDEIIATKINEEIIKMKNQPEITGSRIILATDSNDAYNEWIRNIKIMGKKLKPLDHVLK